jgi:hypothetical protein
MKKHLLLAALLLCAGVSINAETTSEVKEETKKEETLPQTTPAPVVKEEEKTAPVAEEVDLDIDLGDDAEAPTE